MAKDQFATTEKKRNIQKTKKRKKTHTYIYTISKLEESLLQ